MSNKSYGRWIGLIAKSTKIAKALKVFKAVKSLKVLISGITIVLSIFCYSFALGWKFSVGFVALLFVHEMGHVFACWLKKIHTSAPIFIPFLGAAIFVPEIKDRSTEAFVGIGGPILGTVGAMICFIAYLIFPHNILLALAYTATFLNLFNLIPLSPLDGGRVTQAVTPHFKTVGIIALFAMTLFTRDPGLLIIWMICLSDFRLNPKRVYVANIVIYLLMVTLMICGIGHDFLLQKIVDCFLGSGFLLLDYWRAFHWKYIASDFEIRTYPDKPTRLKWLIAYLILTAFLIGTVAVQHGLIAPLLESK